MANRLWRKLRALATSLDFSPVHREATALPSLRRCGASVSPTLCYLTLVLLFSSSICCAQEARWKELKEQWEKLEEQGRFPEELVLLNQAAEVAEKTFGPADSRFGETLADLGNIQHTLGQMEAGEATLKRALAIDEKALGPEHPDVVATVAMFLPETSTRDLLFRCWSNDVG
jgi:hypothetical protein